MASMLNCTICPKKPTFTDVSHLLTHVGSKAHLATLHKLQVKSHADMAAGFELNAYNLWYQQYGLAQLLSQRMQSKEQKQASKQASKQAGIKKKRATKRDKSASDFNTSPVKRARRGKGRGRPKKVKPAADAGEVDAQDIEEPSQYPLTPLRQTSWPPLQSSPPSAASALLDPTLVTTPAANGNLRLKGKIWPGMAMFDAASPEEARRRNQKKDASVVKKMERLSYMIVPNEVTFSTEWSLKKSRHIDDLEDVTSLIEGESPLMLKPRPKPRGKKKALTNRSTNVSRGPKRKPKTSPSPKRGRRAGTADPKPAIARIPSSANPTPFSDPFTPVDGDEDLKFSAGDFHPKKARSDLAIYEDAPDLYPKPSQLVSLARSYEFPAPRLTFHSAPWLQPENQNPLFHDNQFTPYRAGTLNDAGQGYASDKENIPPVFRHREVVNPLMWPSQHQALPVGSPSSSFEPFPGLVAAGGPSDPFNYTRNPLADAFGHLDGQKGNEQAKGKWAAIGHTANPLQLLTASASNSMLRMR